MVSHADNWLHNHIVGFIRGGSLYYVFNDHLGRPETIYRRASSTTQTLVWQAKNLAFTREISTNTLGEFNIGLPGQYFDKESGLWYNWHRYYDASLGRYIQSDPIGLVGGVNTYTYVGGNPVSFIDPMGLAATIIAMPLPGGGFSFNATGDHVRGVSGMFNTGTVNFNQIRPGTYSVSPRPVLPNTFTNWLYDRNQNAGLPTISNTSDWNTIDTTMAQ